MALSNKDRIAAMLKSIETGDPGPIEVVNEAKYVQHNPQTQEGSDGLAVLFARLSKTNPRVNTVRSFQDGDFVFAHMEYDFSRRNVGFEVFRFEDGYAVEHWDNIQQRLGPNPAGRSMVDGVTTSVSPELTEANRATIRDFVKTALIGGELERLADFVASDYIEHNPGMIDGFEALYAQLSATKGDQRIIRYEHLHRVLADGSFVLTACEGHWDDIHSAFYDLFRVADGSIVEHWDTVEKIAPKSDWKNNNGKF